MILIINKAHRLQVAILTIWLSFAVRTFALTNGTFEATPFSTGWTLTGTPAAMPGIAPGSTQGARHTATAQAISQTVAWGAEWSLENYFAVRSTTSRQYSLIIALGGTGSGINMRYEAGAFAVFNSTLSSWISLPTLGTLLPSIDVNADGDLADAGDTKNVYRIRVTGHAFGTAGWNYEIVLSEPNSTEFTRSVGNLTVWQTASGATNFPTLINYSSQNGSNPGYWLDDVKTHEDIPPPPTIHSFLTTAGNISGPGLPASGQLSWNVTGADTVSISGLGTVAAMGTATVSPATLTNYILTATAGGVSSSTASVVIAVNAATLQPSITEFQAADGLLEDEDGDRPDWIELFNPNAFTLNVAGYALTDTFTTGDDWEFPLANIPPGGTLIVFASQKNRAVSGTPLHTHFNLAAGGEYLALLAPGGALVQQFPANYPASLTFPKQYANTSYGLVGGLAKYFKPSTPGAPNGAGFDGVVEDTNFSVKRGIYSTAQTVALSTTTPGAEIRYSTTSAEPTATTGTIYTAPLTISATTTLRVAAFKTNFAPTNVDTNTYIFPADVVTQPTMSTTITQHVTYGPQMIAALTDLPSISVVTPGTIVNGTTIGCSFEFIPSAGVGVQENAGIELFGGAFTNFAKKSFRFKFKAEYGATSVKIPGLFSNHAHGWKPIESFDELELRSGSHDMALRGFYMSNIFTDATMLDAGNLNPHGRFAHMYINGVYWGMFHLRERWSADHHTAYLGGPTSDFESINGNLNVGGWADPGDPYEGTGASWTRIKSLRTNYAQLKQYMDMRSYVDFQLLYMFGNSENEWRSTGPKDIGSGAKYMMNDADGYLATATYAAAQTQNRPNVRTLPGAGRLSGDGPGGVFTQLWQEGHVDYKMLLADRIHALFFNDGALTVAKNQARLTALCAEMERAFYAEAARWSTVHATHYRVPSTWLTERSNTLNNWFPARGPAYIGYLQGAGYYPTQVAPAFSGGTVAPGTVANFAVAGSTVYFTTDGSDPRLPGGAVSTSAFTGNSYTLTQNTWLRARSRNGTTWSALNEAFYTTTTPLAAGDIVFSEIHYNPQGDDDSEFLELHNPTTHAVNLRGAKFTAGLSYDFPDNRDIPLAPGGRLILSANLYSFQKRYGINVPVSGVYFDSLGNDGDTLTLVTSTAAPLFSLNYQDLAPWPDSADGDGYSLILANAAAPTLASSWRSSTATNGNPGTSDTAAPFTGAALADADNDGIPALLEHFLFTNDLVANSSPITASRTLDGRLQITFTRRLATDDITLNVEVSTDLATWTAAATRTAHLNHGNGTATETWTANAASNAQFLRVRVVK